MKTFSEFMIEGRSREEALKILQSKENPNDWYLNNSQTTGNPNWRVVSKENRKKQAAARSERITALSTPEEREQAKRKAEYVKRRGYEAHHITSTKESDRLRRSMSPEQWAERVKKDAAQGIYHGDQPKNIMAAKKSTDPEDKPGIYHRKGGAHSIEGATKDIRSGVGSKESAITTRDLVSAALRMKSRKRREEERKKREQEQQQSQEQA
jgi:hypothetical protein